MEAAEVLPRCQSVTAVGAVEGRSERRERQRRGGERMGMGREGMGEGLSGGERGRSGGEGSEELYEGGRERGMDGGRER
eukprot:3239088-Rhodomonas_salina.1